MALDVQLFLLLNDLAGRSPFFDGLFVFLAAYLPYFLIALFLALLFFSRYAQREKLRMILIVFSSSFIARFGAVELIRFFYHRPRPFLDLPIHQLLTSDKWSFPSGHAAFFFAMATAVYLYNRKWGIGFFVAAALIAISRVVAGIHYPSDILGGALVGAAVAYAVFYLVRRISTSSFDDSSPNATL